MHFLEFSCLKEQYNILENKQMLFAGWPHSRQLLCPVKHSATSEPPAPTTLENMLIGQLSDMVVVLLGASSLSNLYSKLSKLRKLLSSHNQAENKKTPGQ